MLSALATATAATRSLMGLTSEENVEQVEASGGDDLTANAVEKGLCPKRLERITTWLDKQAAENKVAGCSAAVIRGGKLCYLHCSGMRDAATKKPMQDDTIVRLYSMTKPLVSVAMMMLYEELGFSLETPISKWLPCFESMQVIDGGLYNTVSAKRQITIRHLLTHTSGLTYSFLPDDHGLGEAYKASGIGFTALEATGDHTLLSMVELLATMPLMFQPGESWNYGTSTDVLGCLVEIISGQRLDAFLSERILKPLGMDDTAFYVSEDNWDRFAACYLHPSVLGKEVPESGPKYFPYPTQDLYRAAPKMCSGGGGLAGPIMDYLKFCQMMLNKGELNGVRLLGRTTVEFMLQNHLDGDIKDMLDGRKFLNLDMSGTGFGLGFSIVLNSLRSGTIMSVGEAAWGGYASTCFWIDPKEDLACVFFTQIIPSSSYPFRRELRALVNQAIVD